LKKAYLAAVFFVAPPPTATAVEIIGELIAAEVRGGPGLVYVFTSPGVCEGVRFERQDTHNSERVGRVLEGV
jgi:hypothetical protein